MIKGKYCKMKYNMFFPAKTEIILCLIYYISVTSKNKTKYDRIKKRFTLPMTIISLIFSILWQWYNWKIVAEIIQQRHQQASK